MDLKEFETANVNRHPWETARVAALYKILQSHLFNSMTILDIGCGDGFVSERLFGCLQSREITAVDINLTDQQLGEFNRNPSGIRYVRELPDDQEFDLCLLLDVLEHVEDDAKFLASIVNRYMKRGSKLQITVPAFQAIYGRHDVILGHYRRYNLGGVESLVKSQGLSIIASGYLFASLLLPKYLLCSLLEIGGCSEGVGGWRGGRCLTTMLEKMLAVDNSILISLARKGIRVPGLTGWVLCEKPQ